MNAATWLVALATLGVQYSYRTGLDRQPEYVLQIEPEVLPALAAGEQIYSEIPSDEGPFARLCLVILPPDGTPAQHTASAEEQFRQLLVASARYAARDRGTLAADLPPAILWPGRGNGTPEAHYGVSTGWQPDAMGQQQFLVQLDPILVGTLSSGDELYIPIDPAAGRLSRFIVKVGKDQLPKVSQPPQGALDPARGGAADARPLRTTPPFTGGGGGWAAGASITEGGTPSRFGTPPGDQTRREPSQNPSSWPTAGTNGRFSPGEPTAATRSLVPSQGGAVAGHVPVDAASRGYPPAATAPAGFSAPEMGSPPTASLEAPSRYGPSSGPLPAGDSAPRGYGPASSDLRAAWYPDLRTAALPAAPSAPANASSAPMVPQTSSAPAGQAYTGFASASPGAVAPGLPAGGTAPTTATNGTSAQGTSSDEKERPWGLLLFVTFALFFSIGGNLYLAYTALEYHNRYRSALERLRAAARGN